MTLIGIAFDRCSVCQTVNIHRELQSTNSRNSDLDSRPIGMARDTMHLWVHQCRKCGYCNRQLNQLLPNAKETVLSDTYQSFRKSSKYPQLATMFLCQAQILEEAGKFYDASAKIIEAAWVCDDQKEKDLAIECRNKSIQLFSKSRNRGYEDCTDRLPDDGSNEIILGDMLRRTSRFKEATQMIQDGFEKASSKHVLGMLEQEKQLIISRNTAAQPVKNVLINNQVAIQGALDLNSPAPKEPMQINSWREVAGIILLMSVVIPPALAFFVASYYFIDQGPAFLGVLLAIIGFFIVRKIMHVFGKDRKSVV